MITAKPEDNPASLAAGEKGDSSLIEHIQALRRYARALVGNHADAEDIVQETLKRALNYLDGSKRIDNLRAYLFTILHNVRIDALKRRRREGAQVPVEDTTIASPEASQTDKLAARQALEAIQKLSEEHREVLLLVGVEEMTYREAADILGIAIGTVMSRLNRARAALRKVLEIDGRPLDLDVES